MKLGKMIELFRLRVDDTAEPYLWSDKEAIAFAVEAEHEACRRALLLKDSSTAAVCQIAFSASDVSKDLDSRIIRVRRVMAAGRTKPLTRFNMRDLDASRPGWETHTGTVEGIVTDWQTGKLRPYRIPTASITITLNVIRLPLTDMNDFEDTPEINARFHNALIGWMEYKAYLKPDKETYDTAKAALGLSYFEEEFGKKRNAVEEMWVDEQQMFDDYDGTQ